MQEAELFLIVAREAFVRTLLLFILNNNRMRVLWCRISYTELTSYQTALNLDERCRRRNCF